MKEGKRSSINVSQIQVGWVDISVRTVGSGALKERSGGKGKTDELHGEGCEGMNRPSK